MKIKQLRIGSFGKLNNTDISLDERITVIKGKNEAGKSTISAFVRYMLFGFAGRSSSLCDNTKKRFMPWDKDECSGEMDFFTSDGKSYTSIRKTASRNASSIIDNDTGNVISHDCAGEDFLGVSDICYKKTAFIGQNDIIFSDEGELENAIHNIVYSADENTDTSVVLKKLCEARKYFLTKNEKGGKIYETENALNTLREEKQKWQSGHKELISAEYSLSEIKNKLEFNREKLSLLEKEIANKNAFQAKNKIDEIEKCKNKALSSKEEFLKKQKSMSFDGVVLNENIKQGLINACSDVYSARVNYERICKEEQRTAENVYNVYNDKRNKKVAEVLLNTGKDASVTAEELKKLVKIKKTSLILAIVFTVLVITLPVSIVFYVKHAKIKNRIKGMLSLFEINDSNELYTLLCAHSAFADAENTARSVHQGVLNNKNIALEEQTKEEENLWQMLSKIGVQRSTDDVYNVAIEYIKTLTKDLSELSELKNTCNSDFIKYNTLVESVDIEELKDLAKQYDENISLRDEKVLKQEYMFYTQSISALSDRERELEKKTAVLSGTLPKPSEIESKISSLECNLSLMKEKHNALVLAIETIEKASENIKNTAAPYITSRSGELFSIATQGKYKALFSDKEMNLSFLESKDAVVRDALYLSVGTRVISYLCLRIALCEYLYKEKPTLIFDDAFAFVDDERLKVCLDMLWELSEEYQIVILSCHDREGKLLSDRAKVIDFKI